MVKNYMLDTNVLMQNPNSIFGFEDNNIWISGTTLQELDRHKNDSGEKGYNARETCRILDRIREEGNLLSGVPIENGGHLFVEPDGVKQEYLPDGFSIGSPDNRIISTCIHLNKNRCAGSPIILLTNDISMRVNASVCGLSVQAVRNDRVEDDSYTGHADIDTDPDMIDELYANGRVKAGNEAGNFLENEFVTMHAGSQSGMSMYRDGYYNLVKTQTLFGGIRPMNKLQIYAAHALMMPVEEMPLVILAGPAGTSKTFLPLAAGLSQTYLGQGNRRDSRYRKMMISRPNVEGSDPSFGYLPGDLSDKMAPLLASYHDNLETIIRGKDGKNEDIMQIRMEVEDLFENGTIEICPLSYIRGRSIMDSFIICDEAQNGSRKLIKDVVTRAGMSSRVVVTGDVSQCDVAGLDSRNNGLAYLIEHMKGNSLTCIVCFDEKSCVRSPLAEAAIRCMK